LGISEDVMKGKLIVIESGSDASGKATQTKLLFDRLLESGHECMKINFPDYENPSSTLVKMYLGGDFGTSPDDVNAYAASTFFAVDRYASYKTKWEKHLRSGGVVIADRYTTSNMVHQASKIDDIDGKKSFIDWLEDLEFKKMGLPSPNLVIFLNVPVEVSFELMEGRPNKIDGSDSKDIHESDREYLARSYENSLFVADYLGWSKVDCVGCDGKLRNVDDIGDEIMRLVESELGR
jgi:dTMP kinase